MFKPITTFVSILVIIAFQTVLAKEPTVAEKTKQRRIKQIKKNFEKIEATPTSVTGQAFLPDGSPAVGFKIGGWGRSLANPGYGHYLFDTITDQQGRFTLHLYRPCQYWITIDDPNSVYVAPDRYFELKEPLESAIRFSLQKGVPVEGGVIDKDKNEPIEGLPIWLIHDPISIEKLGSYEKYREIESTRQVPKERKTDAQGRFRFAALPEKNMVSLDQQFGEDPPEDEKILNLYAKIFTAKEQQIELKFEIPTPWSGRLLQKDGTPAAFYPVGLSYSIFNGTAYEEVITDSLGRFLLYRPISVLDVSVNTFDEGQWFHQGFRGKDLPPNPVFELYSPLSASGRLVRKSTGEPMKNFKFLCEPSRFGSITTDENGNFEIQGIYLNRKTSLGFVNPPDDDSCSASVDFKTFTPTEPDQKIEFGTIELEESGRLEVGALENLPGKTIEIEGITLDGQAFDWKKYQGKVVLVEFWATWCGPCVKEIPHLKEVYEKYRERGFEIVGISVDEDLDDLKNGLEKYAFPWTNLADQKWADSGKTRMYDRFAVRGVPRGILVDRNGKVITIETRGEKLDAELKKLFPDSLEEAETFEQIESYVEHVFAQSRKNLKTMEDQERFLKTYPPVGIAAGRKIVALGGDDESLEFGYEILLAALGWSLKHHPENVKEMESLLEELKRLDKFPEIVASIRFRLFYRRGRNFDKEEFRETEFDALKEEAKNLLVLEQTAYDEMGPIEVILDIADKVSRTRNNSQLLDETLEEMIQYVVKAKPENAEKNERNLRGYCRRMLGSPFELWGKTVDGKDFDWSLYKGKLVLIDFTASWCGPCRAEMPNVVEMYNKYHDQGLEVICVGKEDTTENLKKMIEDDKIMFPMISEELSKDDARGFPTDYYGVSGIPEIFLVGKDGKILATELRGPTLRSEIEKQFSDKNETEK